ncbi:uncharacterized protein EV422DRAFT_530 [Fimicolochytrium jonesii]|uniref:uncharacterized protein n=1 Tax=Fimicolochytrium jonesii TaxID=1396493 RepID=UPI0022FDC2EE|nr:uncharacterized protein EV422DRAFT_530 [Fimicolochytrium jonesii]KAI8826539.1 hypothetical protein EV422DRAFT_530 [Fimicolochytrium jonesii]
MPKATRKKKLKEQDFKKAKLKVGKKKPAANNDTNVSFKSQAIVVPNQSINDDKPHEEVLSSKNQSLKDLLAQLRHYSAQARKEALVGLRELQHRHPIPLRSHLSALFTSLAPLLVDDEPQVRKLLLSFFDDLAQRVTAEHVRPFMGLTMAYTCSAMTHIGEEVRLDGLRALDVWIRRWPGIVGGFAEKVIPNYLSMLISNGKNKGGMTSTGASLLVNPRSQLGSAKTRVEVLESLLGFLTLILRKDDDPWWFFPSSAPKKAASSIRGQLRTYRWSDYKQTGIVIHDSVEYLDIHTNATASATTPGLFGAGSGPAIKSDRVSIGVSTSTSKVDTSIRNVYHLDELEHLKALTDVLMPTLVDLWLESSPSVFTAGTITLTPALGVMHSVLKMMNLIWRTFLLQFKDRVDGGWVEGWFKGIQKHLMVHFPFGKGNFAHRDKQVDNVLQDMNILFCELLSHFLLQNPTKNRAEEEAGHSWQGLMLDYMLDVFNGKKSKGETATVTQLTPQQLQASLPVVWSLLSTLGEPGYSEFLQAFIAMTNAAGGTPCAPLGFEFLFRLVKLPPSASPSQSDAAVTTHLQTFLLTLPKRLWQLKQSNPTLTLSILSMLLHTLRNNPRGLARTPAFVTGLQSALTPFFWVETPKGGVFGPFVEAAEETQVLALSVGYYLGAWGEKLARGVAECLTRMYLFYIPPSWRYLLGN